jgi:hypothetical protein
MKHMNRGLKKELARIRRCYSLIERHMGKLVRLSDDQHSTVDLIASELQRQAEGLKRLHQRLGGSL